jgi:hypothetical protein
MHHHSCSSPSRLNVPLTLPPACSFFQGTRMDAAPSSADRSAAAEPAGGVVVLGGMSEAGRGFRGRVRAWWRGWGLLLVRDVEEELVRSSHCQQEDGVLTHVCPAPPRADGRDCGGGAQA